jgi:hypothetical protein
VKNRELLKNIIMFDELLIFFSRAIDDADEKEKEQLKHTKKVKNKIFGTLLFNMRKRSSSINMNHLFSSCLFFLFAFFLEMCNSK